uniref:Leupaxin n=1 Tax=Pavo cristatus TaxID=9049 RepID=A0A8C9LB55_PAVCR
PHNHCLLRLNPQRPPGSWMSSWLTWARCKMFTALGEAWHPEHFTCARCGQELGGRPFFERGGQAYCEEDYHQAFSPRCAYCRPLTDNYLSALQGVWHPECFVCAVSRQQDRGMQAPGSVLLGAAASAWLSYRQHQEHCLC